MNGPRVDELNVGLDDVRLGLGINSFPLGSEPVVVGKVDNDSWAEKAGINPGDIILELNGINVKTMRRHEFIWILKTERPLCVRISKTSQNANSSPSAEQTCRCRESSDEEASVAVMSDDDESDEGTAEEASIVHNEKTTMANKASGFLFCDECASETSPMCTYESSSVNANKEDDIESFELHDLVIDDFPQKCIGVRLEKDSLRVVCVTESEAENTWFVNDQITAVQNQKVTDYGDWLTITHEHKEKYGNAPMTVTVRRKKTIELGIAEKATLGMVGGIAGGGAFALSCTALVGVGWAVAAASVVPLALGGLSGTAVGARRNSAPAAFLSGALAGFVGPTATTAFLGGELVVDACSEASEVDV
mmetsp:Transcript_28499/g.45824  ORF Transcript_28499/g.45824 Transcript_28499/m.45824 type:complete len:364 (-) Transcript_28499:272-1363(-)|eukprot:CAMPEP_0169108730 /NCGR_PEP_ID=MMETSP1015-20121227/25586_1 /TAXON_ID=342587 /ORGANISM="Karlodinium micrum, Strain CCMP2283" /LENGTH=363 /DNA_ID=CAMNT_0009170377 /DNA_START=37 /DNA_END=1128 /DNA_ORIENTATION=+